MFIKLTKLSSLHHMRILMFLLLVATFLTYSLEAQNNSQIDSLISRLDTTYNNNDRATLLNDLSSIFSQIDPNQGYKYAEEALNFASKSDLKSEMARSYNYMGGNLMYLSNLKQSITYFNKAKEVFKEIGDIKGLADIEGNVGMVYFSMGMFSKALNSQFKALKAFEAISDSNGICNTTHEISSIYLELGNPEEALTYVLKSHKCHKSINDLAGVALNEGAIANTLSKLDDFEGARIHHQSAIDLFEKLGQEYDLARELSNFSAFYEQLGELSKAIELSNRSLVIFTKLNNNFGMSFAMGNLGAFYLTAYEGIIASDTLVERLRYSQDELLRKSVSVTFKALDFAELSGNAMIVAQLSKNLAKAYEAQKRPVEAIYYFKQWHQVNDSLNNIESQKEIELLTTERKVLLKDKQIELDKLAVAKKRNERVYFIIGILLLLLFLSMLYANYKNQVKSNLLLNSLNVQVNDANSELETKNYSLKNALQDLQETQEQLVISERQKEKAELRSRISQDIHDDISSGLTKISWFSELFKTKLAKGVDKEKLETLVNKINKSSRDTVAKLGEIIWSTSPKMDNVISFLNYIHVHVQSFLEDSEIKYHIDFPVEESDLSMNPEVRRNLYLIVKEALNNAFKYSSAKNIYISFKISFNQYEMILSDDGVGFEQGTVKGGGHGMANMKKRMENINGQFRIDSALNSGTKISCTGPLTS